jgi:hypothetical protein
LRAGSERQRKTDEGDTQRDRRVGQADRRHNQDADARLSMMINR